MWISSENFLIFRWQKIFKSRLLNSFSSYANLYFNIFIVILLILFLGELHSFLLFCVKKKKKKETELCGEPRVTQAESVFRSCTSACMRLFLRTSTSAVDWHQKFRVRLGISFTFLSGGAKRHTSTQPKKNLAAAAGEKIK